MRINKYLSDSGFCSRRKADKLIADKKVMINNHIAEIGEQVNENDDVFVDGILIKPRSSDTIIAFNKPVGSICTTDPKANNTVFDYIGSEKRLFYIGRLDVASSGLMLFTDNGDLANKIAHPSSKHEKEYIVTVDKPYDRKFINQMRQGVILRDGKTKPALFKKISSTRFRLIITEGRNRQIRRMCEALGYKVKKLKRVRIINIKLGDLGEGNWRHLSKKERRRLLEVI
ncbi:rRNA pseudouridine synthase [Candidatus Parcubacteria bacterium]|nr:MAG: rRNA pseudouridine synthase [Candidatus Parcubacteria bacterium]